MKRADKKVLEELESAPATREQIALLNAIHQAGLNGWLDFNAHYDARQLVGLASRANGVDGPVCLAAAMKLIPKEATHWSVTGPRGFAEIAGPSKKLPGCFDGVPQNPRRPRGPKVGGTNRNAQGRGATPALAFAAACFRARLGDA